MWGAKIMKNKYVSLVLVFSIAFLFLAGCATQPQVQDDDDEPVIKPITTPKEVEVEPDDEPEPEPEPAKVMNKKVAELLQKHVGRVNSMRYMYQDQTIKPEEWETWIKGDRTHVKLREMDNIRDDVYIDNIYFNTATQTAEAYCERPVYRCVDPNSPVDVNYKKYVRKTPFDWINEITYAEKESEEQMQQRNVWKLVSKEDGKTTTMWVDEYYGIPLRVIVQEGSSVNEYIYEDIGFNDADESDLEHGFISKTY